MCIVRRRAVVRTVAVAGKGKHMAKSHLKLVTPSTVNRTVTPKRLPNGDLRTREYLTEAEVERLMAAARDNRWGHRDATMIIVAYDMACACLSSTVAGCAVQNTTVPPVAILRFPERDDLTY
jgi:hypothetical protein